MGLFCAPAFSASLSLAGQWFYSQWFTFIVGLTEAIGVAGGVVAQTLLSLSITYLSWQKTFVILALSSFILLIFTLLWVRENHTRLRHQEINFLSEGNHFTNSFNVLRHPRLWFNGLISGFLFALLTAFAGLWAVPYLQSLYGFSLSKAAAISSMTFVGAAIGAPLIGMLSGRYDAYKHWLLFTASLSSLLLSLLICSTLKPPPLLMAILLFLLGFSSGAYVVPFSIIRELIPANKLGFAMGFANMMCIMIGAILQPLIGVLLQWQVSTTAWVGAHQFDASYFKKAFLVFPFCLLVAVILSFFAKRKLYAFKFYKDVFPK